MDQQLQHASANLTKPETKIAQLSYGNYVHTRKLAFSHDYDTKVRKLYKLCLLFGQVLWSKAEVADPFLIEYLLTNMGQNKYIAVDLIENVITYTKMT